MLFGEIEVDQGRDHAHDYDNPAYHDPKRALGHTEGVSHLREHQAMQLLNQEDSCGIAHYKGQRDSREPGDLGDKSGEHQDAENGGDYEDKLTLLKKRTDELLLYDGVPHQANIVACRQAGEDVFGEFIEGVVLVQKAVDAQGEKCGHGHSDEF